MPHSAPEAVVPPHAVGESVSVDCLRPRELSATDWCLWEAYQARSPDLWGPYFAPGWTRTVADVRADVRVAVVHDRGSIIGFLPYQSGSRSTLMPVGGALSDYQGLIGDPHAHFDPRVIPRAAHVGRFDFTHLLASQELLAPFARTHHESWQVQLDGSFDAYSARRRAAGSQVIKRLRKRRRALEKAVGPLVLEPFSQDRACLEQLFDWKQEQYGRTGCRDVLAPGWTRRVVEAAFMANSRDFGGAFFVLRAGERPVAAHFCLRSSRVVHAWFVAFDAALASYSPGFVLFGAMIEHLAGGQYAELDFGAGDYRFKQEFATTSRALAAGYVGVRGPASGWREAQFAVRAAAERLPLGPASQWPAKAMRRLDVRRGLSEPR